MARSKRVYDGNGWLTIRDNPIAKAGVFQYRGCEIAGAPDPDKIYNVLVPPDEFSKQAFLDSFDMIPIIDEHELIGEKGLSTDERPPAGVMSKARFKHPYILSDIKVYSDDLQKKIDMGKVGLSTAYTLDWVQEDGIYEGQPYEYRQVVKEANHLALVEKGRFGKDIAVMNSGYAFNTGGFIPMTLEEILAAAANLNEEERAALLAQLLPAQNEEEDETKNEAEDAEVEVEEAVDSAAEVKEAVEEVKEAVEDGTQQQAAEAAEEAVEAAEEALADAEELEEKIAETAMNAAIKHIDSRNAMASKVRPFIGSVPAVAMNSAESIAEYACKKLGVPHGKGHATIVLNAYLHGRKPASEQAKTAMNSAPVSSDSIKSKLWGVNHGNS